MDLNYTIPQAVNTILAERKIHTIREDKHKRWKEGRPISHVQHARTKNRKVFRKDVCTGVQEIVITYDKYWRTTGVIVDGKILCDKEIVDLAFKDGFFRVSEFLRFFRELVQKKKNGAMKFEGRIIHWTDKRYGKE